MSTTPTIVLVHGFWGGAAHWSKVIIDLSRKGYEQLHAVELSMTSLADDAERTRKMVKQQQGPVLLVGHSYGGAVITEAGDLPNVAGLVYIAAFAPDAGESPGGISEARPPAAFANLAPDSDDPSGQPAAHVRADDAADDHHAGGRPRVTGVEAGRGVGADRQRGDRRVEGIAGSGSRVARVRNAGGGREGGGRFQRGGVAPRPRQLT